MADAIVYTVVFTPGGVDGRDHTAKGGKVIRAELAREAIPASIRNDTRYEIKPIVEDLGLLAKRTLDGLDPVARLAVFEHFNTLHRVAARR